MLDVGSGGSPYSGLLHAKLVVRADIEDRGACDVLADAQRLPFRDQSFDVVLATEVIEHVADPRAMLRELRRVLRPKGRLFLTWPFLWGRHEEADFWRFTAPGLQRIAGEVGLQSVWLETRGGAFTAIVSLLAHSPFEVAGGRPLGGVTGVVVFLAYVLLLPFFLLALVFDLLDRRREFTLGYQAELVRGPDSTASS